MVPNDSDDQKCLENEKDMGLKNPKPRTRTSKRKKAAQAERLPRRQERGKGILETPFFVCLFVFFFKVWSNSILQSSPNCKGEKRVLWKRSLLYETRLNLVFYSVFTDYL